MRASEPRSSKTAVHVGARVAKELLHETWRVSLILFRIMIPVVIVVKILAELGMVQYIAVALKPVMGLVGLPGDTGIVWATAMLTNLYGGIIAFVTLAPEMSLTTAQVTVLASMMLVAHALPVELRIAQKAGAGALAMGLFRFGGALLFGLLLNQIYHWTGALGQSYVLPWSSGPVDTSLITWVRAQILNLVRMFVVILVLMTLIRLLRRLGVIGLLERILAPVLRLLGMTPAATEITVVGMVMGIGYGGGLIIRHATSGRVGRRDVLFSLMLMGLCHSLIEDTLLMATLGAHLSGIFFGRIAFALATVFVLVRLSAYVPRRIRQRCYADRQPRQ